VDQGHFGGKRDRRRHSSTSFDKTFTVTETSYQMLTADRKTEEGLTSFNKYSHVNFSGEKKKNETFRGVSLFVRIRGKKRKEKLK